MSAQRKGLGLCDFFDQYGPFSFQLPTVTQDDRDAAHDALVEIPRCASCDAVLSDDDLWDVHGHANGCDVDETVFACLCGTSGVL
jgi:hypothetical protein